MQFEINFHKLSGKITHREQNLKSVKTCLEAYCFLYDVSRKEYQTEKERIFRGLVRVSNPLTGAVRFTKKKR